MKQQDYSNSGANDVFTLENILARQYELVERINSVKNSKIGQIELDTLFQTKYELENMCHTANYYSDKYPNLAKKAMKGAKKLDQEIQKYGKSLTRQIDSEYRRIKRKIFFAEKTPIVSPTRKRLEFVEMREKWHYLEELRTQLTGQNIYADSGIYVGLDILVDKFSKKAMNRGKFAKKTAILAVSTALLVSSYLGYDKYQNQQKIPLKEAIAIEEAVKPQIKEEEKLIPQKQNLYDSMERIVQKKIDAMKEYSGRKLSIPEYRELVEHNKKLEACTAMLNGQLFDYTPEGRNKLLKKLDLAKQDISKDRLDTRMNYVKRLVEFADITSYNEYQFRKNLFEGYEKLMRENVKH